MKGKEGSGGESKKGQVGTGLVTLNKTSNI